MHAFDYQRPTTVADAVKASAPRAPTRATSPAARRLLPSMQLRLVGTRARSSTSAASTS